MRKIVSISLDRILRKLWISFLLWLLPRKFWIVEEKKRRKKVLKYVHIPNLIKTKFVFELQIRHTDEHQSKNHFWTQGPQNGQSAQMLLLWPFQYVKLKNYSIETDEMINKSFTFKFNLFIISNIKNTSNCLSCCLAVTKFCDLETRSMWLYDYNHIVFNQLQNRYVGTWTCNYQSRRETKSVLLS